MVLVRRLNLSILWQDFKGDHLVDLTPTGAIPELRMVDFERADSFPSFSRECAELHAYSRLVASFPASVARLLPLLRSRVAALWRADRDCGALLDYETHRPPLQAGAFSESWLCQRHGRDPWQNGIPNDEANDAAKLLGLQRPDSYYLGLFSAAWVALSRDPRGGILHPES